MTVTRPSAKLLFSVAIAFLLAACTPRQLIVNSVADQLSQQEGQPEEDLELVREASAFYLKLSESILLETPGHRELATSLAAGFTRYAYAFVAFEADRIEERDARAATRLRQRAARLYHRAFKHAMLALETERPGLRSELGKAGDILPLRQDRVALAYWAAAAWGGWISLSKDEPDVVADLPLAIRLARLAWDADPDFGAGQLTSLVATFESSRPGGNLSEARRLFDQAIAQGQGQNAGAYVAKAEGIALPAGDRPEFEKLLREALTVQDHPGSPLTLGNTVMRQRAEWLLSKIDDLF